MTQTPLSFPARLAQTVRRFRSAACVGLDPRWASLPEPIRKAYDGNLASRAEGLRKFGCEVIDAVAHEIGIVKPQAAFYELFGPPGMQALWDTIQYAAQRGMLVILDGKRNDIGTTAEAYADAYLGSQGQSVWNADSLTVSPYLGDDSLEPFINACDARRAGIFVLVKTSNPGGGFLQDRKTDNVTLYQHLAQHIAQLNSTRLDDDQYGPIGAVVGATYREQLSELRSTMHNTWILVPGFGAQGGGAADVAGGFDRSGLGAVINNSRALIFAYQRKEYAARFPIDQWQDAVAAAAQEMNQILRAETPMGALAGV